MYFEYFLLAHEVQTKYIVLQSNIMHEHQVDAFAGDPEGCCVGRAWHGRVAAGGRAALGRASPNRGIPKPNQMCTYKARRRSHVKSTILYIKRTRTISVVIVTHRNKKQEGWSMLNFLFEYTDALYTKFSISPADSKKQEGWSMLDFLF